MNAPAADHHWTLEKDDAGLAWLRIDKHDGSANVLSGPVLRELDAILADLERDLPRGVVVYSGKTNGFIMGADINEFTTIENVEQAFDLIRAGQTVIDRLEALRCPTVAVIDGFALGGGLELAMACDYRVAVENKKPILGLPEVQLGIHPGFGGTVRAVRLAGVRQAMPLMLTGKSVRVDKGLRIGLIDAICTKDKWRRAAEDLVAKRPPKRSAPFVDKLLALPFIRPFIVRTLIKQVASKARRDHYPAPYAIIDLWSRHAAAGQALEAEARSIAKLMCGETAQNLIRVFFLQNKLKGQGSKDAPRVQRVHVVGAGVMGGDIAAWCALRGLDVTLQDREMKYVQPALDRAAKLFGKKIRNDADRTAAVSRLHADIAGDGVAQADLVIEAIYENLEAKQTLYQKLQAEMKDNAILATNTSSIRLEDLRTVLDRPREFIGLHFFNPVAQLPLVEVIRCSDTEESALDLGFGFVKAIGKFPLACSSAPGFVVNRLLAPYMAEAMHLMNDGVAMADIDSAAERFGMPMGPVELVDSVGLDVALSVSKVLGTAFDRPLPSGLQEMVDEQKLGRKTGQGFYTWSEGKAAKPEPTADQSSRVPPDIEDRLMLPLINEAVACLSEGVVADSDLLDAGVIFGTGFAPFRGGPLNYARARGVPEVVSALEQLAATHGDRFRPHPGWDRVGDLD